MMRRGITAGLQVSGEVWLGDRIGPGWDTGKKL